MNEKDYELLCNACNKVMTMGVMSIERLSIPWLHIVRPHPVLLKKYDILNASIVKFIISNITVIIASYVKLIYRLYKAFICKSEPWYCSSHLNQSYDVLFVSHLLSADAVYQEEDFYFGNIPNKLSESGLKIIVVYINHTSLGENELLKLWKDDGIERIIYSRYLNASDEFSLYFSLRREAKKIRRQSELSKDILVSRIALRSAYEIMREGAINNYRRYFQSREIIKAFSPKSVVLTYEGHAWERVVISAIKSINNQIKCIGYHHTVFFNNQYAMNMKLPCECNADYILAAGQQGLNSLIKNNNTNKTKLLLLGSPRAIKYIGDSCTVSNGNKVCLVLPEGFETECFLLFEFSLKCAYKNSDIIFIWRLHPSISFDALLSKNKLFKDLPSNVIISNDSFHEDIKKSSMALYRGSTSIITAIGFGLVPIYFQRNHEIIIDPLRKICFSHRVSTCRGFNEIANNKSKLNRLLKLNSYALNISNAYYSPMNINVLTKVLEE